MFDLENLMDSLDAYFKANLNTKITAINAEKNDSIILPLLDTNAFILGDLENTNKNFNHFILIQMTNSNTIVVGNQVAQEYTIEILMFMSDNYQEKQSWRKVYRYWRALLETAQGAWDKTRIGSKADITTLNPISVDVNQSSNSMKLFGIELNFTIA
jgi:hypothetical protein